jgi:hypothetical protein
MLQIMKRRRLWLALALAAVLVPGHGVILYYVSSHLAVSTAVFAGVAVLFALTHLGLLGPFYATLRKWRSSRRWMASGHDRE